ncbi:hypothetical protein ACFLS1_11320 [Verrucomicrobiota bacterium]
MKEIGIGIIILGMSFLTPAILAVWFFGLRPFAAKHGRARITAANWGLSMWADWTTAYEIGKETGEKSWAARLFLILWLLWICFFASIFVLGNL